MKAGIVIFPGINRERDMAIALERSGAKLSLKNQMPPLHGATVTIVWNRPDFERPLVAAPLERTTAVS